MTLDEILKVIDINEKPVIEIKGEPDLKVPYEIDNWLDYEVIDVYSDIDTHKRTSYIYIKVRKIGN